MAIADPLEQIFGFLILPGTLFPTFALPAACLPTACVHGGLHNICLQRKVAFCLYWNELRVLLPLDKLPFILSSFEFYLQKISVYFNANIRKYHFVIV